MINSTAIIYSQQDYPWAKKLYAFLKKYRIPKDLGPKRVSIKSLEHYKSDSIEGLVNEVETIIILCSPEACRDSLLREIVLDFKRQGKGNKIQSMIVKGVPNSVDKDSECFPEELRYNLNEKGFLDFNSPTEPIASDIRKEADGKRRAFIKILAGVIGVGFDDIQKREERRERRRFQSIVLITSLIIITLISLIFNFNRSEKRAIESAIASRSNKELLESNEKELNVNTQKVNSSRKKLEEEKTRLTKSQISLSLEKENLDNKSKELNSSTQKMLYEEALYYYNQEKFDYAVARSYEAIKTDANSVTDKLLDSLLSKSLDKNILVNNWNGGSSDLELQFNSNGDILLASSKKEGLITLYSIPEGKIIKSYIVDSIDEVYWIDSKNNFIVISYGKHRIGIVLRWFNLESTTPYFVSENENWGMVRNINGSGFLNPKRYIAANSFKQEDSKWFYHIRFLDLKDESVTDTKEFFSYDTKDMNIDINICPTNKIAVIIGRNSNISYVIDIETGETLSSLKGSEIGFNDPGNIIISRDKGLVAGVLNEDDYFTIWSVDNGEKVGKLEAENEELKVVSNDTIITNSYKLEDEIEDRFGIFTVTEFSRFKSELPKMIDLKIISRKDDGFQYIVEIDDDELKVSNQSRGYEETTLINSDMITSVALPELNGKYICASTGDGLIRVFTIKTGSSYIRNSLLYDYAFTPKNTPENRADHLLVGLRDKYALYDLKRNKRGGWVDVNDPGESSDSFKYYYTPGNKLLIQAYEGVDPGFNKVSFYSMDSEEEIGSLPALSHIREHDIIVHPYKRYAGVYYKDSWAILNMENEDFKVITIDKVKYSNESLLKPEFIPGLNAMAIINTSENRVELFSINDGSHLDSIDLKGQLEVPLEIYHSEYEEAIYIRDAQKGLLYYDINKEKLSNLSRLISYGGYIENKQSILLPTEEGLIKINKETMREVATFDFYNSIEYMNKFIESTEEYSLFVSDAIYGLSDKIVNVLKFNNSTGELDKTFKAISVDPTGRYAIVTDEYISSDTKMTKKRTFLYDIKDDVVIKDLPEITWAEIDSVNKRIIALVNFDYESSILHIIPFETDRGELIEQVKKNGPRHLINIK